MKTTRDSIGALLLSICFSGCGAVAPPVIRAVPAAQDVRASRPPCAESLPGFAHCSLLVRDAAPKGYGPADLWSAYALASAIGGGSGATVAVVDPFDDPNLEADLAVYRSTYGLAPCTAASGCLSKVNEHGGASLPPGNTGWGLEESLDVDMVSAICPNCNILLVEAETSSFADLERAVREARLRKATTISNSYGGTEFPGEDERSPYDAGRPVTAAAGDSGTGVEYPAASRFVTAVGATTLTRGGGSRGWTETGDYNGGCSQYVAKPPWQHDAFCPNRTDNDAAFVGDPRTGVAVYDTYGAGGWFTAGGTSVGAPALAALYALGGNARSVKDASRLYAHASQLYDIPPPGYDEATGNGTPDGVSAF